MRGLRIAGLILASTLLFLPTQAGVAKQQPNKVKLTAHSIWTLAMDWPRVAYASGKEANSEAIHVWNVATGATSVVTSKRGFATHHTAQIAIVGKRLAWIRSVQFGNTELDHWLYTAPLGGQAHLLKQMHGYTGTDCGLGGPQMDGLVGSGKVMAVSTWTDNSDGSASWNQRLNLITPTRLRTIATGPNAIPSGSADGVHIAVLPLPAPSLAPGYCVTAPSTSVYIYSTTGALLHTIALNPPDPSVFVLGIALSGNRLVALMGEQPESGPATVTLGVYEWTTGALVHTWPVAIHQYLGEVSLVANGQLAAVDGPYRLHLVDLNTGKDVIIGPAAHIAIGPRGLAYAAYSRARGKLVFVPTAKLLALVS